MIKVGLVKELNISSKDVMDFYEKNWNRKIALSNQEFYQWQFVDPPNNLGVDTCCIAIDDSNNIILGVMGVNNRQFKIDGKLLLGAELTTWIVVKEHQNKGIGPKIISYLQDKYNVLIGMGITNDALSVYLRKGFKYVRAIPRFIKVIDWQEIEKYAECSPLAKKVQKVRQDKSYNKEFLTVSCTEEALNKAFQHFSKMNNFFLRDFESIKWRYFNHPFFNYIVSIVYTENNSSNGVFVSLRIEEAENGLKILHIIDMFGDSKDMDAAISYVVMFAEENNIPIVDFFSTNGEVNSYFIKNNWFSLLDDDYFSFPHLFQPIELRNPATTSMICWINNNTIDDSSSFYNFSKMYITKADCDFDRPII